MKIRDGYEALKGVRDEFKNIIIVLITQTNIRNLLYFTDYLEIQEHVQRVDKTYQPTSL